MAKDRLRNSFTPGPHTRPIRRILSRPPYTFRSAVYLMQNPFPFGLIFRVPVFLRLVWLNRTRGYFFSITHCRGCWCLRAKSITCVTFVSAIS